jgi:hypothetical protein
MKRKNLLTGMLMSLCGFALAGIPLLSPSPALAQTPAKATGELALARQATVNGQPAVVGLTVFSRSRVKTAKQGAAAVNLGRQGRFELGSETELALHLTSGSVGGELATGRLLANLPAGVKLSVNTPKSLVITDGNQATTLMIEAAGENVLVVAHRGAAIVASGGKSERVVAGEEVAVNTARSAYSDGWRHRRLLAAGVAGSGVVAGLLTAPTSVVGPVVTATQSAAQSPSFATLLNAGINYSITRLALRDRDPDQFFSTTITCRDHDNVFCQRRSGTTP